MERLYLYFTIILLINQSYSLKCDDTSDIYELSLKGIQKGLIYVNNSVADLNIDIYFAILLTYVQLSKIKDSELIGEARKIAGDILENKNWMRHIDSNPYTKNIADNILNAKKWNNVPADNITLKCERFEDNSPLKTEFVIDLLLFTNTSPNEFSFDMCLSELFDNKRDGLLCSTGICHNIMTVGRSYGYSVTHRLLYWLICKIEECNECLGYEFEDKTKDLCCNIMEDALLVDQINFPVTMRDLFMEQVVLCTLSGYWNILEEQWIRRVVSWQSYSGCWDDFITTHKRLKRSSTYLGKDQCSSHATGLGVLLLTLAARNAQC